MPTFPSAFIDDGYTRSVHVDGEARLYPPVDFTYRPMVGKEYTNWFARVFAGSDSDDDILAMMAERITSWSFPQEVTAENLGKMNSQLFSRVLKVLLGNEAPDSEGGADRDNEEPDAGN